MGRVLVPVVRPVVVRPWLWETRRGRWDATVLAAGKGRVLAVVPVNVVEFAV